MSHLERSWLRRRGPEYAAARAAEHGSLDDRLRARMVPKPGCWEWIGGFGSWGYGTFKYKGETYRAHRESYRMFVGPVPEGMQVLHHCDNPPCVRPDHLFLGSNADNVADKMSKGRHRVPHGEQKPNAKLTWEKAREIRAKYAAGQTYTSLSREYEVRRWVIYCVVGGKTWVE